MSTDDDAREQVTRQVGKGAEAAWQEDKETEANEAASKGCLNRIGITAVAAVVAIMATIFGAATLLSDDDEESTATTESTSSSSSSSAVAVAPAPVAPAAAPGTSTCTQYHVTGTWTIDQGGGYTPTVTLQQAGTSLTGKFVYSAAEAQGANVVSPENSVSGSLVGDQLLFVATLPKKDGSSSEGEYKGTVTEAGIANGAARDRSVSGGGSVPWAMEGGTFTCISRA